MEAKSEVLWQVMQIKTHFGDIYFDHNDSTANLLETLEVYKRRMARKKLEQISIYNRIAQELRDSYRRC